MPRKTTRRGKNEGTIYQRKDGVWCGQILLGYKLDGKPHRKTVYGKTREEVARKVTNVSHEAFNGLTPTENTNVTVGQFVMGWLTNFKRAEVELCTYEFYLSTVKTHIIPLLGSIQLTKLSTYQIQEAINELKMVKKLKWRSLKAFRDTLNQAMKHACKMNVLSRNPVDGTKLPKRDRSPHTEEAKAMPIDVRTAILEAASCDVIMKPIIATLMFTGIRTGELLALRWENIDFIKGTLTVDSAVSLAPDYDDNGKISSRTSIVSMPKTEAGYRTIKLPLFVLDILSDWKDYIDMKKPDHSSFVFCSTRTGSMRTYQAFKASFRHFLERNKLTEHNITPHMFRHTHASILLENNVNPRVVQRLLGHADIQTTLGTYSHVMKEVYGGVAEALDNIYGATLTGTYQPMVGVKAIAQNTELYTTM